MTLADVLGQERALRPLARALERGRAHHAYRFEGPTGVGKELAALGFSQAVLCPTGGCGQCDTCRRVATFSEERRVSLHPDVVFLERGLYEGTGNKKLDEKQELSLEQVRELILGQAHFAPHEGRARVFIIRRADELSISAANGLLKTLEEPRDGTYFILMTSRPEKLLPTIRSRTLPIRFSPLPDAILETLLRRRGIAEEELAARIRLAEGSLESDEENHAERLDERESFESQFLEAARDGSLGRVLSFVDQVPTERAALRVRFLDLAKTLARRAREPGERQAAFARATELVIGSIFSLETHNGAPGHVTTQLLIKLNQEGAP